MQQSSFTSGQGEFNRFSFPSASCFLSHFVLEGGPGSTDSTIIVKPEIFTTFYEK